MEPFHDDLDSIRFSTAPPSHGLFSLMNPQSPSHGAGIPHCQALKTTCGVYCVMYCYIPRYTHSLPLLYILCVHTQYLRLSDGKRKSVRERGEGGGRREERRTRHSQICVKTFTYDIIHTTICGSISGYIHNMTRTFISPQPLTACVRVASFSQPRTNPVCQGWYFP
jgi:hypothetical protein